jgi:hypothetical protein
VNSSNNVLSGGVALVWPPLTEEDYAKWPEVTGYFSWFFGHIFDEIIIPVEGNKKSTDNLPAYISAAALMDANKVSVRFYPNKKMINVSEKFNVVLMRKNRINTLPQSIPLKKMIGSLPVEGVVETKNDAPLYYYIGSPELEKQDAYFSVCFTYWYYGGENKVFLEESRKSMETVRLRANNFENVAVFGTGPSLVEAIDRDYDKSISIICNTIVKNRGFIKKLNVGLIVASDAHFHFSFHRYSSRLISDILYLLDTSNAKFFTFDKFAIFGAARIPELRGRIFGIPAGRKEYGFDLDKDFRVFPGESVLNMFLLPFAMHLGDKISLNGFTGRSSNDQFFWGHSDLHQYVDLMPDVRNAHPAFFANRDYPGYADAVDRQIAIRVANGREFGKKISSDTTTFYSCLMDK